MMRVCGVSISPSRNVTAWPAMRRMGGAIWLAAVFLCAIGPASAQPDEKRVALVIGNADYAYAPKLNNTRNDARLVAQSLVASGFTIINGGAQLDLEADAMRDAVRSFGRALDANTVAVLYYSGHGIEYQGENYLIPINSNPSPTDVYDLVRVSDLMRTIEEKHNGMAIIILDACRTNSFPKGLKDLGGGLAQMQAPRGTLIAFATQPGASARDGAGGNSPYAKALADEIRKPGIDVFNTFNEVARRVDDTTGHQQTPWLSSSPITGQFYFTPPAAPTQFSAAVSEQPALSTISSRSSASPDQVALVQPSQARNGSAANATPELSGERHLIVKDVVVVDQPGIARNEIGRLRVGDIVVVLPYKSERWRAIQMDNGKQGFVDASATRILQ
jgi:uncharacterized caspase-like protein